MIHHDGETERQWWTVPPTREASYLVDADPEVLALTLDPLPDDAPAVIRFLPSGRGRIGDQVGVLLKELDLAALGLYPRWLPGAERLEGPQGNGVAAVRAIAERAAAGTRHFAPFLADLAERAMLAQAGRPVGRGARYPAEVRAAGLARVIADAYRRGSTAVLLEVPDDLRPADQRGLFAGAEWLARHGRMTIWLCGGPMSVDRLRLVRIPQAILPVPAHVQDLDGVGVHQSGKTAPGHASDATAGDAITLFPAISGEPRWDSPAEQALERALAPHDWARGRRWNHSYTWDILRKPYRLDLFWQAEGVIVEVDGPEHRGPAKFADDRWRDVDMQLLGHAVLRFTNEQVLSDLSSAVAKIERLLRQRRSPDGHPNEERQNVDR